MFFLFPTIENMVEDFFESIYTSIFMIFDVKIGEPQVSTVRGQQTLPWVTTFRLLAVVLMTLLSLLPGQGPVKNVAS